MESPIISLFYSILYSFKEIALSIDRSSNQFDHINMINLRKTRLRLTPDFMEKPPDLGVFRLEIKDLKVNLSPDS